MKKLSKNKILHLLFPIFTILCIAFIWLNSSFGSELSSQESEFILNMISSILSNIPYNDNSMHIIRKLAHYTEFTTLGFLLSGDTYIYAEKKIKNVVYPLYAGLITALIDETIQLFSEGRASLVCDVWIDYTGVISGIAVFLITVLIYKKCINKNLRNSVPHLPKK